MTANFRSFSIPFLGISLLSLMTMGSLHAQQAQKEKGKALMETTHQTITKEKHHFEPNKGQIADHEGNVLSELEYVYRAPGMKLGLTNNGFHYNLYTVQEKQQVSEATGKPAEKPENKLKEEDEQRNLTYHYHRVEVNFKSANEDPEIIAEKQTDYYANYYLAQCPEGITNVHSYRKLTYKNLYDNIDLVLTPQKNEEGKPRLKYNIRVRPGGDLSDVKMAYKGMEGLSLKNGQLTISTSEGKLKESIPASFWAGSRESVDVDYNVKGNVVSFETEGEQQNSQKTLVVDPSLNWSTYLGGSGDDNGYGVTTDDNGNAYVTGSAESGFPTTSGAYQTSFGGGILDPDAFLSKFTDSGSLSWSTYIGGSNYDYGTGVAAYGSGNVYVTGYAESGYPTTSGSYQSSFGGPSGQFGGDAFLSKFTSSGSLSWSTYFGEDKDDFGADITTDGSGNVYMTGDTESLLFFATSGAYQTSFGGGDSDAFLSKFSSGGSLSWCTYLGGSNDDEGEGITTDGSGNVYVTGYAEYTFPTTSGAYQTSYGFSGDAFLSKFTSSGSLSWSTYLGGSEDDYGEVITTDGSGNVYVTGQADSTFPTTNGAYQQIYGGGDSDAFLTKFSSSGSLSWSTYMGGTGSDGGFGLSTNGSGNVYVTGFADTTFPTTNGAYQQIYGGGDADAFVSKFSSSGSLNWSTYMGGTDSDQSFGLSTNGSGNFYVTGSSESTGFPTTNGAYQQSYGGGGDDAFLTKFDVANTLNCDSLLQASAGPDTSINYGDTTTLTGSGNGMLIWSTGDTSAQTQIAPTSDKTYTLTVKDTTNNCSDTAKVRVTVNPLNCDSLLQASAGPDTSVNYGDTTTLTGSGNGMLIWSTGDTSAQTQIVPTSDKTYTLTVKDTTNNCSDTAEVKVTINPRPALTFDTASPYNANTGVNPVKGTIDNAYRYQVEYTHPNNIPPETGYPRLGIDHNGDGDFTDPADTRVYLSPVDSTDQNYRDGKTYTFIRGFNQANQNLQYSFLAYDSLGSPAKGQATNLIQGPEVAQDSLDLYLYANDIRFSDNNPGTGDSVTISAWIHNNSMFAANNVEVNIYQEGSLLAKRTIASLPANTQDSVSLTYAFSQAGYYPIKVVIDENNLIQEANELNNSAIKPLSVGNFTLPASIKASGSVVPAPACENENTYFTGQAKYKGTFAANNDVTGAEVKVELLETGEIFKDYTNSSGGFRVLVQAPDSLGRYSVKATVTDFTLVGKTQTQTFTVTNCPDSVTSSSGGYNPGHWDCQGNCSAKGGSSGGKTITYPKLKPDLRVRSYQISPSQLNPDTNEYIQVVTSFKNAGNVSTDSFYVSILANGQQLGKSLYVPVLAGGSMSSVKATDSFSADSTGASVIRTKVDTPDLVAESDETNNEASRAVIFGEALDFAFKEPNALELSKPSPLVGDSLDVTARIRNNGGTGGTGKVKFFTIDGPDTTAFDSASLSLSSLDSTKVTAQWEATQVSGSIMAKITETNPQDVLLTNNTKTVALGRVEPLITRQPTDTGVCEEESVKLSVAAKYASRYQWQRNGSDISGATDSVLMLDPVTLSDSGDYRCIVRNGAGPDTSQTAVVMVNPLAEAAFSYQLNGRTASFTNEAEDYNELKWNFGDGTSDTTADPAHTYTQNGSYEVCLIARNNCKADTSCKTLNIGVTIPDTIKGTATLNGDPLEAGEISLWQIQSDEYTKVDSTPLTAGDNGQYNFGAVDAGKYVVKAFPGENTTAFDESFPGYHESVIEWESASVIKTRDSGKVRVADITLVQGEKNPGPAGISGRIAEEDLGKRRAPGDPIGDVEVLLKDEQGNPLQFTLSNKDGLYEFGNLASGTYQLTLEITGVQAPVQYVTLTQQSPDPDSVNFYVDQEVDSVATGIEENGQAMQDEISLETFPNPADDQLNVTLISTQKQDVTLNLLNTAGQKVYKSEEKTVSGKAGFAMDLSGLKAGVYILKMQTSGTVRTKKVVVK